MPLEPENVQAYPRPPDLQPVAHRLRVMLGGDVVAETTAGWRVLETHHAPTYYFPLSDVATGALKPHAERGTVCEWKGRAAYFDVSRGEVVRRRAAWAYPKPTAAFVKLQDHIAFYPGLMEACFVGDVPVTPQPGDFYGGWVTPNLTGIVKGDAATRWW